MPDTNILFVGHDREAADQIASIASESRASWRVSRTADADAANDILNQRNISVVVGGYGDDLDACADFFRSVQKNYPGVIRLAMIPGSSSSGADLAALSAHQIVASRSSDAVLEVLLTRAESVRAKLTRNPPLSRLLTKITTVPTPPALYFDVREEINSPSGNAHSISALIARDAALTARILRIVNSGFFAFPTSIVDLDHAISLLGTQTVLDLVLSVELYNGLPVHGINLDTIWRHAFAVSSVAQRLCAELEGSKADENASSVAGLLHDIGSVVLLANFSDIYPALVRQANGDENALRVLELESFGADHAQLGGLLLDLWCIPDAVVSAVAEHHATAHTGYKTAHVPSKAMMLAEWLVNSYAHNAGALPAEDEFDCPYPIEYAQCARWWQFCEDADGNTRL